MNENSKPDRKQNIEMPPRIAGIFLAPFEAIVILRQLA
jgi:hypothetical protein